MNELTKQQRDEVLTAIRMRINYIETGTTTMSAVDAHTYNKAIHPRSLIQTKSVPIKALTGEQRHLISSLEDAAQKLSQEQK
jgi:hypothetical protein